ncbi:MAG TPA: LacI family transcriptional regulator, partial [Firmicutes bacterium]|nr:LacI family transcriptional regulator [Bacillota bacterium]
AQAYWATAILDGVLDGANGRYVTIMRLPRDPESNELGPHLWRKHTWHAGLCGAIVVASSRSCTVTNDLQEAGIPYVVLGRGASHEHWVWCENIQIVHHALHQLVARERRRIAFVGRQANEPDLMDRLTAYRAWVAQQQQPYAYEVPAGAGFTQRLRDLLTSDNRPDAIFASSLLVAMETLRVAQELSIRVPDELGFVTMAEGPVLAAWHPPLLLIDRQLQKAARLATEILINRLSDSAAPPKQITLPSVLREGSELLA